MQNLVFINGVQKMGYNMVKKNYWQYDRVYITKIFCLTLMIVVL